MLNGQPLPSKSQCYGPQVLSINSLSLIIPLNRAGWWTAGSPLSEVPAPESYSNANFPVYGGLRCFAWGLSWLSFTQEVPTQAHGILLPRVLGSRNGSPNTLTLTLGRVPSNLWPSLSYSPMGSVTPHSILEPHLRSPNPSNRWDLISTLIVDQCFVISLLSSLPIRIWFWVLRTFSAQRTSR